MKNILIELDGDRIDLLLDEAKDGSGLNGKVSSTLHIKEGDDDYEAEYRDSYNSAIDGLESLVLAHACAGTEVSAPAYVAGIQTAVEAISNNIA